MPSGGSGNRHRPRRHERTASSDGPPLSPEWRRFGLLAAAGLALVLGYVALRDGSADVSSRESTLPETSQPRDARTQGEKKGVLTRGSGLGDGWKSKRGAVERREPVIADLPVRRSANDDSSLRNVERLLQVKSRDGSLTQERAGDVRRTLRKMATQGTEGTAAIEDLRRRLENGELDAGAGSGAGDETSTTVSSRDAGSEPDADPDGVGPLLERLTTTTDPMEIAMLAQELEEQAPGEYRREVFDAARLALRNAAKDPPEERVDVSPVFETLEAFGDDDVVKDLEQDTIWRQYSLMTLAGMPDGKGIPSLLASASDPRLPLEQRPQLAFQMLAQAAAEYPQAGDALIDLARSGQIPARAWRLLGSALEGMHLKFPLSIFDETNLGGDVGTADGARVGGFENGTLDVRYDLRLVSSTWSQEQIDQQIDLIDRLLDATGSADGRQVLSEARNSLLHARPAG